MGTSLSYYDTALAEAYHKHGTPREPETGAPCVHNGCPRPGTPQPDGEVCCPYHRQHHGGELEQGKRATLHHRNHR